jgi:LytS/YehU family sensor histidine kinase
MTIPDDALDALVPNLILQPLVENAIRHGVARVTGSGVVEIVATRDDAALCIEVRDDGPGFGTATASDGHRVGLANARTRLTWLYGAAHQFETGNRVGGGARVRLRIPWHTAPVLPGMPNVRSRA